MTQTGAVPHQIPLMVANLGDNLTLTCPIAGDRAGLFFWYKMKIGYMIQIVAKGSHEKNPVLSDEFNNARFTANLGAGYSLHISDVCKDDEGIYFCQSGSVYEIKMTNATILVVRDPQTLQNLITVKQDPVRETFLAGAKVNLQCSLMSSNQGDTGQCPGEDQCPSVHWFRAGLGESHASMLYTEGNISDTDGRSCDYKLSESLDEGTYYCAFATCGKILFGSGTRVEIQQQQLHLAVVIVVPLLCCVIVIAVLIMLRKQKESKVCRCHKGVIYANQRELYRADEADSNDFEDEEEARVNYAALNFSLRQKRSTEREQPHIRNTACTS